MISASLKNKAVVKAKQDARIRAMQASGALGRTMKALGQKAYTTMRGFAHVQTGALKASVTLDYKQTSPTSAGAVVYLNPSVRNPRGGKPADYGKFENAKGGTHAFLDRTSDSMRNTEIVAINELTRIIIEGTE